MERLSHIEHAYFIMCFSEVDINKWPPPYLRKKTRIRKKFIMSRLKQIEDMGINVIFAGSQTRASSIVEQIFEEFLAEQPNKKE